VLPVWVLVIELNRERGTGRVRMRDDACSFSHRLTVA
jgi:hypothetical protein